jgi:hypothetical protein
MVLSVFSLSFYIWPWYCLSSHYLFTFNHGIVCPLIIFLHLTMVLSVLSLSFYIWPWYCLSSHYLFTFDHGIVCLLSNFLHLTMVLSVFWYLFGIFNLFLHGLVNMGPLWSRSYGSWIYNYLSNQCLLPLTLWVWTPFMARCTRYHIMW